MDTNIINMEDKVFNKNVEVALGDVRLSFKMIRIGEDVYFDAIELAKELGYKNPKNSYENILD